MSDEQKAVLTPDLPRLFPRSPEQCSAWRCSTPFSLRFAQFWANTMPRGRGWVPRFVGRRLSPDFKATILTGDGVCLAVDPAALEIYTAISRMGSWDPNVLRACRSLLSPGQVFFDIGANVGFMSVSVAASFHDQVQVFSFEPQRSLAEHIAVSAGLNQIKNLQVLPVMLGKEDSTAQLFLADNPLHNSKVARSEGQKSVSCPVFSLDGLIESGKIPEPNVIKIDVEGAELEVLKGAARTIGRKRPFIIFESDANADRFGYKRSDLADFIGSCASYRFLVARDDGFSIADDLANADYRDLVAVPEGQDLHALVAKSRSEAI